TIVLPPEATDLPLEGGSYMKGATMILETAIAAMLISAAPAPALTAQANSSCLHTPGQESPQQRDRSVAALAAARAINTAQSRFAALNGGKYGRREDLTAALDAGRYHPVHAGHRGA